MDVRTLRAIDKYAIGALSAAIGLFVKSLGTPRNPVEIRRVLLIKLWAIGDSILTLPLVQAVRDCFPGSEIDVLCHASNRPVFENTNGLISKIIEFGPMNILKLRGKYDVCFDTEPFLNLSSLISAFAATRRAGFHNRLRWLHYHHTVGTGADSHALEKYLEMGKFFGIHGKNQLVPLGFSGRSEGKARALLAANGIAKDDLPVGFFASVGASVKARQWPKENFRDLARRILGEEKSLKILLFGTREDFRLNEFIKDGNPRISNLAGNATLEETFCLIRSMRAFLSNDTGPMHIAAAQGVPTLGLFGPSSPALWGPYGEGHICIWHGPEVCEYSPCNLPHDGLVPECYLKGDRRDICIRSISVEEVHARFRDLLR